MNNKNYWISSVASLCVFSGGLALAEEDGKAVYEKTCVACHGAGVAGAPKLGDVALWKDRIAKGMDALFESSINGVQGYTGFMPAKGGNVNLTDDEVKAAVTYMVEQCTDC